MNKFKMKLALKIWLAIYPSITLFQFAFGEALATFPLPVKTLILTAALVPWVVFVGLPAVEFILKRIQREHGNPT